MIKQCSAVVFVQLGITGLKRRIALSDLLADQMPRLLFTRDRYAVSRALHLGRPSDEGNSCWCSP